MKFMKTVKMRKWTLLFGVVLLFVAALEIDAVQQFTEVPTYTEVRPGADALLKCKISDKKGICSWQKDNKPVGMHRGKYEWATAESTTHGDCSLLIRNVKLAIDEGLWQCQVTVSHLEMQDALSSPPARLAVRVALEPPRIIYNGSPVLPDQKIKLSVGSNAVVMCEVRHANPPAYIEWHLESSRYITWPETNATETDSPRAWAVPSTLDMEAMTSAHGTRLVCQAHHPSYSTPYFQNAYATLNVKYVPAVIVVGSDADGIPDPKEGFSTLSLNCLAEGNPKRSEWWTEHGQDIVSNCPTLVIVPLARNHSALMKNGIQQFDREHLEVAYSYEPRTYSIEMLNVETEVAPGDNSPTELPTLLPAETDAWSATDV